MSLAVPICFIILMWWFSTGAVLWFAGISDGKGWAPMTIMAALGVAGLGGVYVSAVPGTGAAALPYVAVLSALAVWAFIEFTFLTGALTGSRTAPCPQGAKGSERFWLAFHTISYHEYALLAALVTIGGLGLMAGGSLTAFATFGLLWVMRISAKLTLFSGAPKFALDMMPTKIAYMQTYFRHDRVGPVFWLTTVIFTAAFVAAIIAIIQGVIPAHHHISAIMLTTLLGLGVLEHWFMVLPIADSALWRWALPSTPASYTDTITIEKQKGEAQNFRVAPGYNTARQNRREATS